MTRSRQMFGRCATIGVPTKGWASLAATTVLTVCTFLLTRHTQIGGLTGLLAPAVLATSLIGARVRADSLLLLPAGLYAAASVAFASMRGVEAADAFRFFAIICGTLLATQWGSHRIKLGWVLLPVGAQAIGITLLSIYLGVAQDTELALGTRALVVDANWGDIYTLNGWYYRVQLIGNALIPLAFMICMQRWNAKRGHLVPIVVFGVGVIAAGNLTYSIVCGAYAAYILAWRSRGTRALLVLALFGLASALLATDTINDILTNKFDGSDSSMGVRFDQVDVLADAFAESPASSLLGHGLGSRYPDGKQRDYSQFQYIELQILYVTYQIGIVGVVLLFGTIAIALNLNMSRDGRLIFWAYVLCGISNPYVLDTNQMVATMLLLSTFTRQVRVLSKQVLA